MSFLILYTIQLLRLIATKKNFPWKENFVADTNFTSEKILKLKIFNFKQLYFWKIFYPWKFFLSENGPLSARDRDWFIGHFNSRVI
jgi:hypothetical protein